jgi:hypothetical protein
MRLPENSDDTPRESAGVDFVKRIGLLGAILFLILSIIGTLLMLFGGREEVPDSIPEPIEPFSAQTFYYTIPDTFTESFTGTFPSQPF